MALSRVELQGITWNHPRGIGGLGLAADAYRNTRPDVLIRWTARSLQAFADQSLEELSRRFDLLYIDHPAVGHAAARGCLLPLDRHADPAVLRDQLCSSVGRSAESYEWGGHRWALATDAAAQVAAYRPDLLERTGLAVPRTWDEALELAATLRRRGSWVALPAIPVDAICAFLALCVTYGGEPFSADPDHVAPVETGEAVLDLLASIVARSHPSSLSWNPPGILDHMATEDDVAYCPLAFGYSNYARPGFRDHLVRFAAGPAGDDAVPRGTLGGAGLAVSAWGQAPEEAVAFASFVADAATQRGVYFDGGGQPAHRSAWTNPSVNAAASHFFDETIAAVDAAYLRPRYDGFLAFQDTAGTLVHAFLRDPSDPKATLERIDDAYRASLNVERS
jgi:multiple sugar transport system substrate-binding protein